MSSIIPRVKSFSLIILARRCSSTTRHPQQTNDYTVKPVKKATLKKTENNGFQDQLSLNAGQKYRRMLQGEHSAILLTFIKLPIVIKIFNGLFWSGCFGVLHRFYYTQGMLP